MNLAGRKVTGVRRVEYVLPDGARRPHGPLELALDGDERIVFDAGPNGESLRSTPGGWRDPFGGPQPPDNETYLARAGRWVARDVSAETPYDAMVGALISDTAETTSATGKLTGLVLITRNVEVRLEVQTDELVVTWEPRPVDD